MKSFYIDGRNCHSSFKVASLSLSGISGEKEVNIAIAEQLSSYNIAVSSGLELVTISSI
jgi:transcription antitermination factor NusA-like protein